MRNVVRSCLTDRESIDYCRLIAIRIAFTKPAVALGILFGVKRYQSSNNLDFLLGLQLRSRRAVPGEE